ncbi:hypothetical protein ACFWBN_21655 [Streptomyces sp. NPDC059989]|uniref:hypothetical protein n=1 Tax=Streptomyces sp. NPDC059989 TaxID=3347026 RepID=UPI00369BA851
MGDTRRDTHRGQESAAALLGANTGLVAGLHPWNGPQAWIAYDQEVRRRLRSRSDGAPQSKRTEIRLCDPDGRIRASALAAWRLPTPELVVIRCADWVPAVRERARRVLGRLVAKNPEEVLVRLAPLVLHLGRREHGAWARDQLEAALSGRYSLLAAWWRPGRASTTWSLNSLTARRRDAVLDRLRLGNDLPARRFAARLSVEGGRTGVRELAARARVERDRVTSRIWTDGALAALAAGGPDDAAIDELLAGKLPLVRASGLTALRAAGRAAEAADHLADRSGLVRARARSLVRQDGGDPYALHRALVEDPARVTPYAVAGFAECARREDAPLLRTLSAHPAGAVRAAAVAGLYLLEATDDALLLPLLDDPSPAVAREAARALRFSIYALPTDRLQSRLVPGWPVHTRRAAYRLLLPRGGITALRAAVALVRDEDPVLREAAARHVQLLCSRRGAFFLPKRDPEVAALLDRCEGVFDRFVMGGMRGRVGIPRAKSKRG